MGAANSQCDAEMVQIKRTSACPKNSFSEARRPWLAPLALVAFALALRLYQLGAESLWIDEGYSIFDAQSIESAVHTQRVRPLYYIFLSLWMHLGHSEFFLRLPSAVFGAGAVLMCYLLGRRLIGERGSLFAGLLMAISPLHVNHSQEIRMYSLATLLSLVAVYEFVRLRSTQQTKHLVGNLGFILLATATFPLSALMLLIENMTVLLDRERQGLRKWVVSQLAVFVPCAPLLILLIAESDGLGPSQHVANPSVLNAFSMIGMFSLFTKGPHGSLTWYAFWVYTIAATCLITFTLARSRRDWHWRHSLLALWLVLPILITAELTRWSGAQWLPRYVIYASPAFFLLLGLAVSDLPGKRLPYLAAALFLSLPAVKLVRYYERSVHPEWRQAVAFVQRNERPGDVIAIYRPGNGHLFDYYYTGSRPWQEVGLPKLQKRGTWNDRLAVSVIGPLPWKYERVWLLMSEEEPEAGRAIAKYAREHEAVLRSRHYSQIDVILFQCRS